MFNQEKRRKIDLECRAFKDQWSVDYFVVELNGKVLCLLCSNTIAVLKEYNIRRHYQSKHSGQFSELKGKERNEKLLKLKRKIAIQQKNLKNDLAGTELFGSGQNDCNLKIKSKKRKLGRSDLELVPLDCEPLENQIYDQLVITWTKELRKMDPKQQVFAKKYINDILFQGQLGALDKNSIVISETQMSQPLSPSTNCSSNGTESWKKGLVQEGQQNISPEKTLLNENLSEEFELKREIEDDTEIQSFDGNEVSSDMESNPLHRNYLDNSSVSDAFKIKQEIEDDAESHSGNDISNDVDCSRFGNDYLGVPDKCVINEQGSCNKGREFCNHSKPKPHVKNKSNSVELFLLSLVDDISSLSISVQNQFKIKTLVLLDSLR